MLFSKDNCWEILPTFIKLEVLKEMLLDLYKTEEQFMQNISKINDEYEKIQIKKEFRLNNEYKYKIFFSNLKESNLDDDTKKELYRWAKIKRNELRLNDNLLNVSPDIILDKDGTLEKVNQYVKSLKNF